LIPILASIPSTGLSNNTGNHSINFLHCSVVFQAKIHKLADWGLKIAATKKFGKILFDLARCALFNEMKSRVIIDSVRAADTVWDY
jgi:hypothetical protein